jgi:putative hydrolase of the HAD superfamily
MSGGSKLRRVILWDFDGTLAHRPGGWRRCLVETLDEFEAGHQVDEMDLVPFLKDGYPWHAPHVAHPHWADADAWWTQVEPLLSRAFAGVGYGPVRSAELARLTRARYVDATLGWQLYDDSLEALSRLQEAGWRHAILSNHVPELSDIADSLGLTPFVMAIVNSAVTGYEKPHAEAFAIARRVTGDPDMLWMVGDNFTADVKGAEAAGIPAILVRRADPAARRQARDLLTAAEIILEAETAAPTRDESNLGASRAGLAP